MLYLPNVLLLAHNELTFKYEICYSLRRILLPKSFGGSQSPQSNVADLEISRCLVRRVIKDSMSKLEKKSEGSERLIRWELGSCWVQHLQKQETPTDDSSKSPKGDKAETVVRGLGKQFKMLKKREKMADSVDDSEEIDFRTTSLNVENSIGELSNSELKSEAELKKFISEEAFLRLKETRIGLHLKVSHKVF